MRATAQLRATILHHASPLSKNSSSSSRLGHAPLSLEHFLVRQRVVSLYRSIMRAVYTIPSSQTRYEMRDYARNEFSRNREVSDVTQIRYLVSTGKTEFDNMRRYVEELAAGS